MRLGYESALALVACLSLAACAPNREQWLAKVANQQAVAATADIGSPEQFKTVAYEGATALDHLRTGTAQVAVNPALTAADREMWNNYTSYMTTVSSRLQAVAVSTTEESFTASVFALCDADAKPASAQLGPLLTALGEAVANYNNSIPPWAQIYPGRSRPETAAAWETFGARLSAIPGKCAQVEQAMDKRAKRNRRPKRIIGQAWPLQRTLPLLL